LRSLLFVLRIFSLYLQCKFIKMPRLKRIRKITGPPHFRGFTPIGLPETDHLVLLQYEEYEAIRLCDFDGYNHLEASRIMNISRPTFARIYEEARRKVALAFIQGLPIIFEGGKVYYDSEWYSCERCRCKFNQTDKAEPVTHCALCGSEKVQRIPQPVDETENGHICVCPSCGHEQRVPFGMPCSYAICGLCNFRMRRKGRHQGYSGFVTSDVKTGEG
jgi:uncharacterized protein